MLALIIGSAEGLSIWSQKAFDSIVTKYASTDSGDADMQPFLFQQILNVRLDDF